MRNFHIISILLLSLSASAHSMPATWQLLAPGEYHGDEAPAEPGTGWLALTAADGTWRLEPTIVRATRVNDAVLDEEGQKTGLRISSDVGDAIALIRHPAVKAGRVDTPNMQFADSPRPIYAGDAPLNLSFNGTRYVVAATDSAIYLQRGTERTLLADLFAGSPESDSSTSLLWAGDLDRDGKLDLLFSYSGYNDGGICLFLSSGARDGVLVQKTACHGGVGC